ncbi:hypothetical protein AMTR_s03422p00001700 [Amborella trichopoda]|uniref:Uncharacterized protein n=1 Tax=Amborella trichopoda TaxID=13333 RepID=U5CUW0_AMBTC|nr:hypothetical protein AMTR_s03422p00001700 [Amborella trichopoda]
MRKELPSIKREQTLFIRQGLTSPPPLFYYLAQTPPRSLKLFSLSATCNLFATNLQPATCNLPATYNLLATYLQPVTYLQPTCNLCYLPATFATHLQPLLLTYNLCSHL